MKKVVRNFAIVASVLVSPMTMASTGGGNVGAAMNTFLQWVQIFAYIASALIFAGGLWAGWQVVKSLIAAGQDKGSSTSTQQGASGADKGKSAVIYGLAAIIGVFFSAVVAIFASDLGIDGQNSLNGFQINQSSNQ